MFIIFNKDKILSYLISISTVTILLVLSFAITKNNDEILKTSTNTAISNKIEEETSSNVITNETSSNVVKSNQIQEKNVNNVSNNNVTTMKNATNAT